MQTHTLIGERMLSGIPFLEGDGLRVVRSHHERWDGGGYPDGLAEYRIPLTARIFAVADSLDAMTSDRPYRQALPWEAAHDEILAQSGRQFDPQVVAAFLDCEERLARDARRVSRGRLTHTIPAVDFDLTPEQKEIQALTRDFVAAEIEPHAAEWDREHRFPARRLREARRARPDGRVRAGGVRRRGRRLRRVRARARGALARRRGRRRDGRRPHERGDAAASCASGRRSSARGSCRRLRAAT